MTARRILMAAALAIAAWLALFGDKTPTDSIAEPVARAADRPAQNSTPVQADKSPHEPVILALQSRDTLVGGASADKPANGLFDSQNWTPPPPPPPKPAPPPPPTAPPLPFTYLGKKIEDGVWEVYLSQGEQTLIARAQSTIDGIYRVESIQPPTLSLTYLPLNQTQTLTIGEAN